MLLALSAALVPVAVGIGLALTPLFRRGLRGPASAFAIAVALSVVGLELLPEAAEHIGAPALVWLAVGLLGPGVLERIAARVGKKNPAAELGFIGLCAHQVIDGVQVGGASIFASPGVAVAVGAHSVPLVAAVCFGFVRRDGARSALIRGGVLLVATAVGAIGGQQGAAQLHDVGFLPALIGGLLLHVLWHDLWERPPGTTRARLGEVVAFAAGLALPVAWLRHEHPELEAAALHVLSISGLPLLLGFLAVAFVRSGGVRFPIATSTFSAILPAARLPVTACSVLPVSEGLAKKKAHSGAVLAFLLLTPALGAETLIASVPLLGAPFAVGRLGVAVLAALAAGLLMAARSPAPAQTESVAVAPQAPWGRRALLALDETLLHVGPWLVAGTAIAIAVEAWVEPSELVRELNVLLLVAIPAFVCATSALPVAAVLLAKGASPTVVLVALVVGPALNAAAFTFLRRTYAARALAPIAVFLLVAVLGAALVAQLPAVPALDVGGLGLAFAAGVGLLLARSIWTVGPRGWLAVLSDLGGPGTGHDHGHDHGHAHEHRHAGHDVHADPVEAVHAGERAHDHCHEHDDE